MADCDVTFSVYSSPGSAASTVTSALAVLPSLVTVTLPAPDRVKTA